MLARPGSPSASTSTQLTRTATSRSSWSSAAPGLASPPSLSWSSASPVASSRGSSSQTIGGIADEHTGAPYHLLIRLIKLDQNPGFIFFSFLSSPPFGETFWVGSSLLQPAPSFSPPSPSLTLLFPIIPLLFLISFIHSFIIVDLFMTIVDDRFVFNG